MTGFPASSLILLVGPPAAGKTTWAHAHFEASEIVSSDVYSIVSSDGKDDGEWQTRTIIRTIVEARCQLRRRTVIDALNLDAHRRWEFRQIARAYAVPLYAVLFRAELHILLDRHEQRLRAADHPYPSSIEGITDLRAALDRVIDEVRREGYIDVIDA